MIGVDRSQSLKVVTRQDQLAIKGPKPGRGRGGGGRGRGGGGRGRSDGAGRGGRGKREKLQEEPKEEEDPAEEGDHESEEEEEEEKDDLEANEGLEEAPNSKSAKGKEAKKEVKSAKTKASELQKRALKQREEENNEEDEPERRKKKTREMEEGAKNRSKAKDPPSKKDESKAKPSKWAKDKEEDKEENTSRRSSSSRAKPKAEAKAASKRHAAEDEEECPDKKKQRLAWMAEWKSMTSLKQVSKITTFLGNTDLQLEVDKLKPQIRSLLPKFAFSSLTIYWTRSSCAVRVKTENGWQDCAHFAVDKRLEADSNLKLVCTVGAAKLLASWPLKYAIKCLFLKKMGKFWDQDRINWGWLYRQDGGQCGQWHCWRKSAYYQGFDARYDPPANWVLSRKGKQQNFQGTVTFELGIYHTVFCVRINAYFWNTFLWASKELHSQVKDIDLNLEPAAWNPVLALCSQLLTRWSQPWKENTLKSKPCDFDFHSFKQKLVQPYANRSPTSWGPNGYLSRPRRVRHRISKSRRTTDLFAALNRGLFWIPFSRLKFFQTQTHIEAIQRFEL